MLNLESSRTLFIFSHPNHEVALLALAGRLHPKVIILTDGGAQRRCQETRFGLKALGLLESACFFDYSEDAFYRALLAKDIGFFRSLGQRLEACSMDANPDQVLCDAIEFYNPIHDMCLPIVRSVFGRRRETQIFEVPLVYQERGAEQVSFAVQQIPPSKQARGFVFSLSAEEIEFKLQVLKDAYPFFMKAFRNVGLDLSRELIRVEVVSQASSDLPKYDPDRFLRYEARGRYLKVKGQVKEIITFSGHYLPVAEKLWNV